jgi:Na+/H+ antiporter NhaD/arsenite permease-like protein
MKIQQRNMDIFAVSAATMLMLLWATDGMFEQSALALGALALLAFRIRREKRAPR